MILFALGYLAGAITMLLLLALVAAAAKDKD